MEKVVKLIVPNIKFSNKFSCAKFQFYQLSRWVSCLTGLANFILKICARLPVTSLITNCKFFFQVKWHSVKAANSAGNWITAQMVFLEISTLLRMQQKYFKVFSISSQNTRHYSRIKSSYFYQFIKDILKCNWPFFILHMLSGHKDNDYCNILRYWLNWIHATSWAPLAPSTQMLAAFSLCWHLSITRVSSDLADALKVSLGYPWVCEPHGTTG